MSWVIQKKKHITPQSWHTQHIKKMKKSYTLLVFIVFIMVQRRDRISRGMQWRMCENYYEALVIVSEYNAR